MNEVLSMKQFSDYYCNSPSNQDYFHCPTPLSISCNASGGKGPYRKNLPYPPVQVQCQNNYYASILSQDYAGKVSELSAITQYVNHETKLIGCNCEVAQTLTGIAMVEMTHLQIIGELIVLLGGNLKFEENKDCCTQPWTPCYLAYGTTLEDMIRKDIAGEKAAIAQYNHHIHLIGDPYIKQILKRIILDEMYHIELLESLLRKY